MNDLAMLLDSADDFANEFKTTTIENRAKASSKKTKLDHLENLLQQSRKFQLKGQQHNYSENDPILFVREPTANRRQQANCGSCDYKFQKVKELLYCQFCGVSTCKDCLKKTRPFFCDPPESPLRRSQTLGSLSKVAPRGKVCLLCDRKFIINSQMCSSFKEIDMLNLTIKNSHAQVASYVKTNEEQQETIAQNLDQQQKRLDAMDVEV